MLARASYATAQIKNKPEVASTENPQLGLRDIHVLVCFAVEYRPVREVKVDLSMHDVYILYPTNPLCDNLHKRVLTYNGFQEGPKTHEQIGDSRNRLQYKYRQ